MSPRTGSGWLDGSGHDEDSDDKVIDGWADTHKRGGGGGGGGNQRGGNPSNRACLPIALAMGGGALAVVAALAEAAHRVL